MIIVANDDDGDNDAGTAEGRAREAIGKFGVPYGPDAVAFATATEGWGGSVASWV